MQGTRRRQKEGQRRKAFSYIFIYFHIFSYIFKHFRAFPYNFMHIHLFTCISVQVQNLRKGTSPSRKAFPRNFKNDARSHPLAVNQLLKQIEQLNGRRELPDETAPSAHHPRELNKIRRTKETYLNAARRWPVPGVGRRRAH